MWKRLPPADAAWQGGRIYPSAAAAAAAALPGVKLGGVRLAFFVSLFIYLFWRVSHQSMQTHFQQS